MHLERIQFVAVLSAFVISARWKEAEALTSMALADLVSSVSVTSQGHRELGNGSLGTGSVEILAGAGEGCFSG